jgi:hypothetical protein
LRNLEDAKYLSKTENENNNSKLTDEIYLQNNDIDYETLNTEISDLHSIDLDYETIHSEILENIILDENDSGVSDFDGDEEEQKEIIKSHEKIFNIVKIKNIIHKSVASLFEKEQQSDEFKPLLGLENIYRNNCQNNDKENKNEEFSNNTELKTQDNTIKTIEDGNNNYKMDIEPQCYKDETLEKDEKTKEEEIVNYRKYNYFTDPNSNFNNFTRKYEIKTNPKKRFRDIHPFLKTFNPKFLKKENIDKKIFRRFRKFVKALYKKDRNYPIFTKNPLFWQKFYMKNLLPPVKIMLNHNGHLIEHKSFNTQYLVWLFNQKGTSELFESFIKDESENVVNNFIYEYNLNKSKEPNIIEKLKQYIKYIPEIYSSNDEKDKTILEESKEKGESNYLMNKDEDDLESIESSNSSNPFNLKFDEIERKNFKENPYYDDAFKGQDNSFYSEKLNNFNEYFRKGSESNFSKFKFDYANDEISFEHSKRSIFK